LFFYQKSIEINLKEECLKTTINAIKIKINRHQEWLDTPGIEDKEEILNRLNQLKADLEKYENRK